MTSVGRAVYRRLLWLYPRAFREEYGPDLEQLLLDQLRDEHPTRVWTRLAVDLAITVPSRHLETRMDNPPNGSTSLVFTALCLSGLILAIVGGSTPVMLVVGLFIAVPAGALAYTAHRGERAVAAPRHAAHWWKFLVGGAAILATLMVVTTATGELAEAWWLPAVATGIFGLALMAFGAALGIAALIGRLHHRAA